MSRIRRLDRHAPLEPVRGCALLAVYALQLLIVAGVVEVSLALRLGLQSGELAGQVPVEALHWGGPLSAAGFDPSLWALELGLLGFATALALSEPRPALSLGLGALALLLAGLPGGGLLSPASGGAGVLLLAAGAVDALHLLRGRQRMWRAFRQYVPAEIAAQYDGEHLGQPIADTSRELSILFCDIHGFSALSEQLPPARLSRLLNRYFDTVSVAIVDHGGTIDKFMGDAVMAFWGAPLPDPQHPARAVAAALEIQRRVRALARDWQLAQLPDFRVGVGVATGECFVGHLGSRHRQSYTVLGDTVNTAQRLEKATRRYLAPVIVNERAAAAAGVVCRPLDTLQVPGKHRFLTLHQALGERPAGADAERHAHAVRYLQERRWAEARELFTRLRDEADEAGETAFYQAYLDRLPAPGRPRDAASGTDQ